MSIDVAASAHVQRKANLAACLAKPNRTLKPPEVAADDKCVPGQWLDGEGRIHAGKKECAEVVQKHAQFHKATAEVVRRANAGEAASEEVALGAKSEFAQASGAVALAPGNSPEIPQQTPVFNNAEAADYTASLKIPELSATGKIRASDCRWVKSCKWPVTRPDQQNRFSGPEHCSTDLIAAARSVCGKAPPRRAAGSAFAEK